MPSAPPRWPKAGRCLARKPKRLRPPLPRPAPALWGLNTPSPPPARRTTFRTQIATLALPIARAGVRASVVGLVVAQDAQLGAVAGAACPRLFILTRDGAIELRADVVEGDLLRLAPDQAVTFVSIGPAGPFTGTMRLVEPTIDLQTRLSRVRIAIDDPDGVVKGMFLSTEILAAEAIAVPVTPIGAVPDGASAMRMREGRVDRVTVSPGDPQPGRTNPHLLSDLATVVDGFEEARSHARLDGREVVVSSVFRAKSASEVSVAKEVRAGL